MGRIPIFPSGRFRNCFSQENAPSTGASVLPGSRSRDSLPIFFIIDRFSVCGKVFFCPGRDCAQRKKEVQ
jgi:hypothetical protein